MCAINPVHKKRLILDVYTSDANMPHAAFIEIVVNQALLTEIRLNANTRLRWHVKESQEDAE